MQYKVVKYLIKFYSSPIEILLNILKNLILMAVSE